MFYVCLSHTVLFVPCSIVVLCWERADLLALLCMMFPYAFVVFPYDGLSLNIAQQFMKEMVKNIWSIENSGEILNKLKSIYTSVPHNLIKEKTNIIN